METTITKLTRFSVITQGDADNDNNCPAELSVNLSDIAIRAKSLYSVLDSVGGRSIKSSHCPVFEEFNEEGEEFDSPYDYCIEVTDCGGVCVYGVNKNCSTSTIVVYLDFNANEGLGDASK